MLQIDARQPGFDRPKLRVAETVDVRHGGLNGGRVARFFSIVGQRRVLTSLVGGQLRTSAKDRYARTIATLPLSLDCLSLSAKTKNYITCEVD